MRNRGFTLIELLISLAIFTIIGIATVKHISQLAMTKNMAFDDLDLYNEVRAALSLMRADLSQGFHVLYDDLGEENKNALLQNQPIAHTLFDGRKNELIFTSLSHRVYYAGKRESEQTEVSYFLQKKQNSSLPSLMKRESEIIDADLYQGGQIFTILDNVSLLEFDFWDDKQGKWVQDWSSDGGGFRDKFPMAVRVKVEVRRPNNGPKLAVETEFKIAFPNNELQLVQLQ